MRTTDLLLTFGATLRLTRLVTTDDLGEWIIAAPAKNWAGRHDGWATTSVEQTNVTGEAVQWQITDVVGEIDPENGWRSKLVSGLDCKHCCGFWIGAAVLAARNIPGWRPLAAALTLSAVVGVAAEKLDYA